MPSNSTITAAEKALIKRHAGNSTDKVRRLRCRVRPQLTPGAQILAAAIARIYIAHPDPSSWRYTGLEGAMVFGNTSRGRGGFWLKLVDIVVRANVSSRGLTRQGTRGVIWQHELYEDLVYHQDRTFFHSFAGDVRPRYADVSDPSGLHDRLQPRRRG